MAKPWNLQRTRQCPQCPWRKTVNPLDIPQGYDEAKHQALAGTIANPDDVTGQLCQEGPLRVMVCHETDTAWCIGWLVNQLKTGNNIRVRLRMLDCQNTTQIRLRGVQHSTFEETLPS